MKKSNSYWDKRALNRYNATELKSQQATERIKKIYRQAYYNIEKELESVYKNYSNSTGIDQQKLKEILSKSQTEKTFKQLKRQGLDKYIHNNYKARINRLEEIKAQIYAKAKMIYPKEELEQTMLYRSVLNDNYYKTVYDTQMGTGYNFSFSQLDKNTINTVLKEKWSGKNYSDRIWKNTDILAERLSTVVSAGLMSGQNIEKMTRQIRNEFNTAKYYAERLVRTESSYFHNQADMLAYQDLDVDRYVFVATLDNRTSEICQEMDNKKFDYDKIEVGVNFPPLHPNCRSTTRGYLGEDAEKMLKRRARNPITGKTEIVDNIPYSEWKKQYGHYTESERHSKNNGQPVNWNKIKEKSYKEKINTISDNDQLNKSIYETCKRILKHRDNSLREDLYLLDYKTGNVLGKQTNMVENEYIEYNQSVLKALKENKGMVAIHNHPNSLPPSDKDINACLQNKYKFGIVATHDGKIYMYSSKNMKKPIDERDYMIAVEKYTKMCYNDTYKGQLMALKELSKLYKFRIEEVV